MPTLTAGTGAYTLAGQAVELITSRQLLLLGDYGAEIEWRFAEIVRDFGEGYDRNVLVGNTEGQLFYRLTYKLGCKPILDPESLDTVPELQYVWRFFGRRKVDGAAFYISIFDPGTNANATRLVKFADPSITYAMLSARLFSTGLLLRQHRS